MSSGVSVVIVAYDNGPELSECVQSVLTDCNDAEVILVNNGDAHGVLSGLTADEGVRVVEPGRNMGFATGCNLGAQAAAGEVLLFLNPDALVVPGAIGTLSQVARRADVGLVMPQVLLRDEPDLLNSRGGALHLCGLGWASGYRKPREAAGPVREVAAASGAALAVRRQVFVDLGGFLDELFLYHEDAELSWRAHLQGLKVLLDPAAAVLHAYDFSRHPAKLELLERNRLVFVLTCYSGRLLALLVPVLLCYEAVVSVVAWREGWLTGKRNGWRWCWSRRRWLLARRRVVQGRRQVPERSLGRFLTPVFDPAQLELPGAVGLVNVALRAYWGVVRRMC